MIAFIANEWRRLPQDVLEPVGERWSQLAFRAMAALHKAGIPYTPVFPED